MGRAPLQHHQAKWLLTPLLRGVKPRPSRFGQCWPVGKMWPGNQPPRPGHLQGHTAKAAKTPHDVPTHLQELHNHSQFPIASFCFKAEIHCVEKCWLAVILGPGMADLWPPRDRLASGHWPRRPGTYNEWRVYLWKLSHLNPAGCWHHTTCKGCTGRWPLSWRSCSGHWV